MSRGYDDRNTIVDSIAGPRIVGDHAAENGSRLKYIPRIDIIFLRDPRTTVASTSLELKINLKQTNGAFILDVCLRV